VKFRRANELLEVELQEMQVSRLSTYQQAWRVLSQVYPLPGRHGHSVSEKRGANHPDHVSGTGTRAAAEAVYKFQVCHAWVNAEGPLLSSTAPGHYDSDYPVVMFQ
jgi:hypothetical protein